MYLYLCNMHKCLLYVYVEGRNSGSPQPGEDDWAKDEYRKLMGVCNKYEVRICDPICKNLEQSRIFENSDFCIMVFCISKAFFCSSIKSVIQIGLVLQG